MEVFNSFYYSFSPAVAGVVTSSPEVAHAARLILYPLVRTLQVASYAQSCFTAIPELGIVMAGLVASALIGILYLSPIVLVVYCVRRKKRCNVV